MSNKSTCPDCGGEVYRNRCVPAGPVAYSLLPGLGGLFHTASFTVLVCAECGLTRLFADQEARSKIQASSSWNKVS